MRLEQNQHQFRVVLHEKKEVRLGREAVQETLADARTRIS